MAFIEVSAEFNHLVMVLERIAEALERAHPLPTVQDSEVGETTVYTPSRGGGRAFVGWGDEGVGPAIRRGYGSED